MWRNYNPHTFAIGSVHWCEVETTEVSIKQMNQTKCNVYINGISFSHKSNEILIHATMDKPRKQFASDKPITKYHILNVFMYLHCPEWANLWRDLWLPWPKERRGWNMATNGCSFWGQQRCSKIRLWWGLCNSEYTRKPLNCTLQICEIFGCKTSGCEKETWRNQWSDADF